MSPPTTSEIVAKLNLTPHPEGGFYSETFRDPSIVLSTSQLPPEYKVDRPVSTSIYFLLPSGNVSLLHRIPMAETWHFYLGEPLTVLELNDKDGSVKLTRIGPDIGDNQQPQYTVPPNIWFGSFPTKDYSISEDWKVVKNAPRDGEKHYSLVGCTCAPAFQYQDFELAKRSELLPLFPNAESLVSLLTLPDRTPVFEDSTYQSHVSELLISCIMSSSCMDGIRFFDSPIQVLRHLETLWCEWIQWFELSFIGAATLKNLRFLV